MKLCPFFKKDCIESKCMFWTHLLGTNPQTGNPIDEFNCAISWLPTLLIEAAKNITHAQAAVEDFRNKSLDFQNILVSAVQHAQLKSEQKQLMEVDPKDIIEVDEVKE